MPRKQDEYLEPECGETDTRTQDWDPFQRVRGRRFIVHTLFEEKIWVQNKREMPVTNVNRLAREIEEAQAKRNIFFNSKPRSMYGSTLKGIISQGNEYQKAVQKIRNLTEKLKTMNQGALQVQLAKIENRRKNHNKNLNEALKDYGFGKNELIDRVYREYLHWTTGRPKNDADIKKFLTEENKNKNINWTPQLRALKFKILGERIKNLPSNGIYQEHFKKIAPIAIQKAKIAINEKALKNAVNLRKKHIGPEKPARNRFRSLVAQKVLPPIIENINLAPMGRKTLNAMRRFPGFKNPTLEEYAREKRKVDRLEREVENLRRALKRKRNNNNRN